MVDYSVEYFHVVYSWQIV